MSNSILSIKIVAQVLRSNIPLTYSAEEAEPELFVHRGIFFYRASEKQSNTTGKKNFPLEPSKKYQTAPISSYLNQQKSRGTWR